ncbi:heterokaryon incompatibility protein-domain-containing protein [Cladorrhinum samala]|uniref:Heterokaryon incompatibility protein-domain-containing protein n=1 Tax=Cladorrhinum samala TaxID=585594 RepID=A0AAV9HUX6_9PEZI|nr:heterokaryon incompatibility protein-domain-containing protein [Cladorrhinum samala]
MRLLRADTLEVVEFMGRVPPYVILSHTWGPDEVSFQDLSQLSKPALKKKTGYDKIAGCCARALEDGYQYVWVDTCCIDKTSSAELSEAINSMYRWYQEAHICYAYMADVTLDLPQASDNMSASFTTYSSTSGRTTPLPGQSSDASISNGRIPIRTIPSLLRDYDKLPRTFENSRWFTRGWTLQELIAPPLVEFYAHDWQEIGTKYSLRNVISKVTGIDVRVLEGADPSTCHVAERMSWAANRQTTRVEDEAYCLLGIFKVHMPLIYGEGRRAFYRLQKEIMKTTEDYTMLAWGLSKFLSNRHHWKGVSNGMPGGEARRPLADSPNDFEEHNRSGWKYTRLYQDASHVVAGALSSPGPAMDDTPPLITSRGLRLTLLLRPSKTRPGDVHAYINCKTSRPGAAPDKPLSPVCLVIRRLQQSSSSSLSSPLAPPPPPSPSLPGSSSAAASSIYTGSSDPNAAFILLDSSKDLSSFSRQTIYLSTATIDSADLSSSNHRIHSLSRNLYILDKPPPLRAGEVLALSQASWKITSCFSHAVGSGPGHAHFEVPRKFTSATLFQPFELPPNSVRLFAFEQPQSQSQSSSAENTFGIVVGNGWCDVVPLADEGFRSRWGTLVRDGAWNERNAMRYIERAAATGSSGVRGLEENGYLTGGSDHDHEREAKDRVVRRVGFAGLEVGVKLKKVRRGDINCESAIKILWSVSWQ